MYVARRRLVATPEMVLLRPHVPTSRRFRKRAQSRHRRLPAPISKVVDTWTTPVRDLLARYPELRFYELPTITHANPLFRAWLDGAMRSGISEPQSRKTTTLYVDKVAFRQALGLPHEDTIYVLLVDREGHVFWRGEGQYSAQLEAELEPALAGTAQQPDWRLDD